MNQIAKINDAKVFKQGSSYAIRIQKALVDAEVLKLDKEYEILILEKAFSEILSRNLNLLRFVA